MPGRQDGAPGAGGEGGGGEEEGGNGGGGEDEGGGGGVPLGLHPGQGALGRQQESRQIVRLYQGFWGLEKTKPCTLHS